MSIRVGINGFGRIGRLVMRAAQSNPNISIVPVSVEIKFRAPHAIDAMLSLQLCLLDGVAIQRHRRDVVPVTASARLRGGSRRSTQYFSG